MFPAYISFGKECSTKDGSKTSDWLENQSFNLDINQTKLLQNSLESTPVEVPDTDSSSSERSEIDADVSTKSPPRKRKKKRVKEQKEEPTVKSTSTVLLEFDGHESFYIDKEPSLTRRTVRELRYRRHKRALFTTSSCFNSKTKKVKRYFRKKLNTDHDFNTSSSPLDEQEYSKELGQLNRKMMDAPDALENWVNAIKLQECNPYKWSRLLLAEKKIDIINRALAFHPGSERLYELFINTVTSTYPAFEVSQMLDRLIAKDPYNFTLWTARIMSTQGTMARCVVPDVLQIYERSMSKMNNAKKALNELAPNLDEVMLKLFTTCALFLRQAGLYEQFIALTRLALELNISATQFGSFAPLETDQHTLIEYEELVLQSGLPISEIWLRIEKLRQGFCFLPCPENMTCSDPQRIVFNEDVCHYIYPLRTQDNSFFMLLTILHLMKLPFLQCHCLAEKFGMQCTQMGESDAIEDIFGIFVRFTYAIPIEEQDEFLMNLYDLGKEMAVSPTFIITSIGHEIYTRCLIELLTNCAAHYEGKDERKRIVFILLLCRFERVLLLQQKYAKKLTADYIKSVRSRFKILLKQKQNREVINCYTEFALFEFETLEKVASIAPVKNIFENIIAANSSAEANHALRADMTQTVVCYAEVLAGRGAYEDASQVIAAYALAINIKEKENIPPAKKLAALQKINEKLDAKLSIERTVEIMVLEQYLLPDYTIALLKLRVLLQWLIGQKLDAISYLERQLKIFLASTSDRHKFLREQIQQLKVFAHQLPSLHSNPVGAQESSHIFAALKEYPRNLVLLQCCAALKSLPWYKISLGVFSTNITAMSVVFLVALMRHRFLCQTAAVVDEDFIECDRKHIETNVRNRILDMFKMLSTAKQTEAKRQRNFDVLRRNGLFWRLFLRCVTDQKTSFETSKQCLLTALDECPWNKSLYLDGSQYVPQELPHLQDLIIEKQLRIYALPEELEILREK